MNKSRSEPTQARRIINNQFTAYLSDQTVEAKSASNSQSLLEQVGNKLLKLRFVIHGNVESAFSCRYTLVFRTNLLFKMLLDCLKRFIALVLAEQRQVSMKAAAFAYLKCAHDANIRACPPEVVSIAVDSESASDVIKMTLEPFQCPDIQRDGRCVVGAG